MLYLGKKEKGYIMKKVISAAVLAALVVPGIAGAANANAQPNMLQRWFGGVWYGTVRGEMSLMNWKNDYSSDVADLDNKSESFSFESVFGGSLAVGHIADANWRGELEAGLIGRFTDSGYGADFKLTIPYVSVNVMYDFANNVYVGGGLGVALPKMDLGVSVYNKNLGDWIAFDAQERKVTPKFDMMIGYSYGLTEQMNLDFRYKLSVMFGPDVTENGVYSNKYWLKTDLGTIVSNSFSIGLRYEF